MPCGCAETRANTLMYEMKISWKFRIANWLAIDLAALSDIIRRAENRNNAISKVDIEKLKSIMGDIRGIMTGKRGENK